MWLLGMLRAPPEGARGAGMLSLDLPRGDDLRTRMNGRHTLKTTLKMTAAALLAFGVTAAADVIDSFDRADGDTLGATEKGGLQYVETSLRGQPGNVARVEGKRMLLTGDVRQKPDLASGRVFLKGYDAADTMISFKAEFRTDHTAPTGDDQPRNSLGILLRARQDAQFGQGKPDDADTGYVSIEFFNNGQFLIRERRADGKLAPLGKKFAYAYRPGSLGKTHNDLPYDGNDDGMLGSGEPFTLSVAVLGRTLKLSINGKEQAAVTLSTSGGAVNGVGFFKGRPSATPNVLSDVLIDDLSIEPIPTTATTTTATTQPAKH
jgi:hypothetical protein